jgi:Carboxypeptidase regulatory-like domain
MREVLRSARASFLPVILLARLTMAQTGTAQISGHIQDPAGAPIPNTHLAIRNVDTGISREVTANSDGDYTMRSWWNTQGSVPWNAPELRCM